MWSRVSLDKQMIKFVGNSKMLTTTRHIGINKHKTVVAAAETHPRK